MICFFCVLLVTLNDSTIKESSMRSNIILNKKYLQTIAAGPNKMFKSFKWHHIERILFDFITTHWHRTNIKMWKIWILHNLYIKISLVNGLHKIANAKFWKWKYRHVFSIFIDFKEFNCQLNQINWDENLKSHIFNLLKSRFFL